MLSFAGKYLELLPTTPFLIFFFFIWIPPLATETPVDLCVQLEIDNNGKSHLLLRVYPTHKYSNKFKNPNLIFNFFRVQKGISSKI